MAKLSYKQLEQKVYNFIPPQGEYPPCYGICEILNKQNGDGTMVHLRQIEDEQNPIEMWHDATGHPGKLVDDGTGKKVRVDVPREIGKERWVKYDSFEHVELVRGVENTSVAPKKK